MSPNIQELVVAVRGFDRRELADLEAVIASRRAELAREAVSGLQIGSNIRFAGHTRPRMLAYHTAVVTGIMGDKIVVDLPHPVGKWFRNIRVPASLVEKV